MLFPLPDAQVPIRCAGTGQGDLQDQKITGYQSPLGVTHTRKVTLRGVQTQSGFTFDQVEVSYQTLGMLSPRRDNAILVCHALSGTAHAAGLHPETGRPGWWDFHVGPGKAIDTDKFFVVCSNVLGGCDGTTGPLSTCRAPSSNSEQLWQDVLNGSFLASRNRNFGPFVSV